MAVNETQLVQLFEQVLTLSKVDASQSVAILKSHYSDARTVRAATARRCGWAPGCMPSSCRRSTIRGRWATT